MPQLALPVAPRHRSRSSGSASPGRTSMPGCATPPIPRSCDPDDPGLSRGRERLFRGSDGAARAASSACTPSSRRASSRTTVGPGARGRVSSTTGNFAPGTPVPGLVPAGARRAGAGRHPRRERAGRRQELLPAARASSRAPTAASWPTPSDEDGSERFRIHVSNLETGEEMHRPRRRHLAAAVEWAEDGRTLLYVELNEQPAPVPCPRASPGRRPGRRRRALRGGGSRLLRLGRQDAAAARFAPDRDRHPRHARGPAGRRRRPAAPPCLVAPRREGHRYSRRSRARPLFILTNDRHENFRLVSAPEQTPDERTGAR